MEQINAQGQKGACELFIANALWGQEDYPFLNSFVELNNSYYLAELETVDFINSKEREKARTKINKWVEKKTKKNIKDFLSSGMLDSETRLVLINAIYFKGNWANQFKKSATQKQDFYLSSDGRVQAPLMFQKEDFRYAETDALKVLELPYKGEDLSMLVFLPKAKDGLPELEHELTSKNMTEWQRNLHKIEIEVYLPKFTFNSEFQLAGTLSNMGMPAVFGPDADFSGITENDNLFISNVIHKALVEVNEKGTKAVAVTGLSGIMSALDPTPPPVFRADHPFVFLIKDNSTETILFLGRMSNPTKEY
jgi:serpin B